MPIAFDIETVPRESALTDIPEFEPPSNYKDEKKIAEYLAKKKADWAADAVRQCSLDPDRGKIVSIAIAGVGAHQYTKEVKVVTDSVTERDVLKWFWQRNLDYGGSLVSFAGKHFDAPFIIRRSMYLAVPPTGRGIDLRRYSSDPHYDCAEVLSNWDMSRAKSLSFLCRMLDIPVKQNGMNGSSVYQAWKDGKTDEIAAYNLSDAEATWQLYLRIKDYYR